MKNTVGRSHILVEMSVHYGDKEKAWSELPLSE